VITDSESYLPFRRTGSGINVLFHIYEGVYDDHDWLGLMIYGGLKQRYSDPVALGWGGLLVGGDGI